MTFSHLRYLFIALLQIAVMQTYSAQEPIVNIEEFTRGFWHQSAWLGNSAGIGYYFRPDGSYIYVNYAPFNRDVSHSGEWSLVGDELTLITTERTVLVGGEKDVLGIFGGEYVIFDIEPPEVTIYSISEITQYYFLCFYHDLDGIYRPLTKTIFINGIQYWRYALHHITALPEAWRTIE